MALSSMSPTILLDNHQNVELILGSAGGSKITSAVAYVRVWLFFVEWKLIKWCFRYFCGIYISMTLLRKRLMLHESTISLSQWNFHTKMDFQAILLMVYVKLAIRCTKHLRTILQHLQPLVVRGKKLVTVYDKRRRGSTKVY